VSIPGAGGPRWVGLFVGLVAGIFGCTAGVGLTGSWAVAALSAVLAAGGAGFIADGLASDTSNAAAVSRGLRLVVVVAALLGLIQLTRLAVFAVDPSRVGYSFAPASPWEVGHSCLSAYFVAAESVSSTPNVYDDALYSIPGGDPTRPRTPRTLGSFRIDVYEYPPPFLLLPRALRLLTPDFPSLRTFWFGLDGLVILLGLLMVARFMGPAAGAVALLLSPLVWVALPTLSLLQKGNVQGMVIVVSMLAMLLFERGHRASGGAVLAFVTVSKLYPGLLIVYLLARRQWRALAWTAAFAIAFVALSIADTGWAPYAAFLDRLPGLVGGEAFPAFRNPASRAINFSIPGLVFKLGMFGIPHMSFGAAKVVGWIYTLVAGGVTAVVARRTPADEAKPLVWLAILILATLRSPFLPQAYAAFPALWMLTLLAATQAPALRRTSLILAIWVVLNIYWPTDWPMSARLLAIVSGVPQAMTLLLALLALRFRPTGITSPGADAGVTPARP
jgi:alpha-1,2-mannosyltransferase